MFFVRDQRELTSLNTALSFKGKNEDGKVLQVSMDFISDEEGVKDNFIDMSDSALKELVGSLKVSVAA